MKKLLLATFGLLLFHVDIQAQKVDLSIFEDVKIRNIGPAGMSGRVTSIDVVRDQPDIIYAGTASGGLWKSTSGGIKWDPIFDKQKVCSIGAVAIDQKNPSVIWAGTGEGNPRNSLNGGYGIYKSLDGGKNWSLMGLEKTRNIHRIIIHADDPNTVYAAAIGSPWGTQTDRGVYRTQDGGVTWERVLYLDERTGAADLVVDPSNPNKLMAAMWEHRRWPYFFKSGGPSSGLYVTHDGGDNWVKRTDEDGLPKGDLGRIGLAISQSNPSRVYALIESNKNALYRSNDGGFKWEKVKSNGNFGNRPFYYYDIFVDPSNENRIYSLHSLVTYSEDGGDNWKVLLPYSGVHPDHHAWYMHPDNPDYIIEGNDGGLNISRDRGDSWRFVENLPLAQFYHINYDMETPYNVYGGMQDNGSWKGPSQTWRAGGIRNAYWEELFFGDGFDVVPDKDDNRYGYAMSQGGNVGRYDTKTGYTKFIKPVHPDGTELRYNWNAGIAQDPFDNSTLYYGSQFVHKTTDKGDTWSIISPDLTTNDPEKQKQLESGGLTYDVTGAENYTTILAIEPSSLDENVIWVGTDDGNVQLTRNGGETWTNFASRLPGAPTNGWVPQIVSSTHNVGEAFVVINNYRQNDFEPYLYHTRDFGSTWNRIGDSNNLWGFTLSVVQDPVEPSLLFCGTDHGLFISFDYGSNWNKWENGYPSVSTIDLKIHPREHDLIIGTFGRAAWIMDDIRPLRAIASEGVSILSGSFKLFEPPTAYLNSTKQAAGTRFAADAIFAGDNRDRGAMITYFIKESKKKKRIEPAPSKKNKKKGSAEIAEAVAPKKEKKSDTLKIEIMDANDLVIRTLNMKIKEKGIQRFYWDLREKGTRRPGQAKPKEGASDGGGLSVIPGTYAVKMTWQGNSQTQPLTVKADPRLNFTDADFAMVKALNDRLEKTQSAAVIAVDRLDESKKVVEAFNKQLELLEHDDLKAIKKEGKVVLDSIKAIREKIVRDRNSGGQKATRDPNVLSSKIGMAGRYMNSAMGGSGKVQNLVLEQAEQIAAEQIAKVNKFYAEQWPTYRKKIESLKLNLFKDYQPIKLN